MSQEEKSDENASSTTEYLEEDQSDSEANGKENDCLTTGRTPKEEAEMEKEWKKNELPHLAEIAKAVKLACQDDSKTPELKGYLCAKKIRGIMEKGSMLRSWKDEAAKKDLATRGDQLRKFQKEAKAKEELLQEKTRDFKRQKKEVARANKELTKANIEMEKCSLKYSVLT